RCFTRPQHRRTAGGRGPIEVDISQERFRRVGAGLKKILARAGKSQVMSAHVDESATRPLIRTRLVRRLHNKLSFQTVKRWQRRPRAIEGSVNAYLERNHVAPLARRAGRQMSAPLRSRVGPRL